MATPEGGSGRQGHSSVFGASQSRREAGPDHMQRSILAWVLHPMSDRVLLKNRCIASWRVQRMRQSHSTAV